MKKQRHILLTIFKKATLFAVVFMLTTFSETKSQMFDFEDITETQAENNLTNDVTEPKTSAVKTQPSSKNISIRSLAEQNKSKFVQRTPNQNNKASESGASKVSPIDPNEEIYMYMRNFKITRNLSNRVNCSMRFYLESKVKEKISNISYRLKWPKIETVLSFSNVSPEGTAYYDYTLLGNGCYEMDSAPNIIVNRCRIKGRTQEHCASLIKWRK